MIFTFRACKMSFFSILLHGLHDLGKDIGLVYRKIRQYFAIDLDIVFVEIVDQARVGRAVQAGGGIDTNYPQAPKHALLRATIPVFVLETFFYMVFGYGPDITAKPPIAFGELQHLSASVP